MKRFNTHTGAHPTITSHFKPAIAELERSSWAAHNVASILAPAGEPILQGGSSVAFTKDADGDGASYETGGPKRTAWASSTSVKKENNRESVGSETGRRYSAVKPVRRVSLWGNSVVRSCEG
ncbi:hypothetical protein J1614_000044 [Plenodomus biglobosus]|nr:hypothetical protein J1614_000044 [Plenodomus biglobosus]